MASNAPQPGAQPASTTALALPAQITRTTFKTEIERWAPEISKVAYRGFTPDRVFAAALEAAVQDPKLFEATPQSLYRAVLRTARWGLDIGDTVFLVPINKKVSKRGEPDRWVTVAEAWPAYTGLKALAIRQGVIRGMEEFVVYTGDQFEYQLGLDAYLRHRPCSNPASRGAIIGAYSIIRLPFGERTFNYMPIADIEAIRGKSRSWGPDKSLICPPWYAKKTAVRDYLNRQPKLGADLREALASDDAADADLETGEVFGQPALRGATDADGHDLGGTVVDDLELDRRIAEEGR